MALKTIKRLAAAQSVLFVCDIQELFRPLIYRSATVIDRTVLLTKTSRALDMPVVVTRQYPKVFGETCREIQNELDKFEDKDLITDVAKTQFSMLTPDVLTRMDNSRKSVILCGIEAHVCVLQTALDLLENGKDVFVVCDSTSSQKCHDRAVAMRRLESAGAILTTSESVLFDLVRDSKHAKFKELSAMLKDHNRVENEFAQSSEV